MAEMFGESLIPDKPSVGHITMIVLFLLLILFAFPWLTANLESAVAKNTANFYWSLGISGLVAVIFGFFLGTIFKKYDFDVPIYSNETAFGKLKNWHVLIMLLFLVTLSLVVIQHTASQPQAMIYEAPAFQAVTLGPSGSAILSALVGTIEELAIVAFILGLTYFMVFRVTKQGIIAFLATLFIVPSAFAGYHWAVYSTDVVSMQSVFFMGFLSTVWILIMRNMLLGIVFHASNNFSVVYFKSVSLSPGMIVVDFLLFYIVAYGLIFLWWFTIGRRSGGET